jgi:hypothetical protein
MTNSSSSGGGTTFYGPGKDAKHSLNVNDPLGASGEEAKIEGLLMNEEERLMEHDEEIFSDEEVTDHDKEERKMITVALVKSVVETTNDGEEDKPYGLRERRRPTGDDLRLLEHNQSTNDGGLARAKTGEISQSSQIEDLKVPGSGRAPQGSGKMKMFLAAPLAPESQKRGRIDEVTVDTTPQHDAVSLKTPPAQLKRPAQNHLMPPKADSPVNIPIIPASSTVPNPLSALPIQASTMSMHSTKAAFTDEQSTSVPCPLPAAASIEKPDPLVMESSEKRKVTISEPESRPRAFSIDLDLGQFDITGDQSSESGLPLGGGRPRTFSFECYSFGINADEPLPPLDDSMSTGRPRGDSIIFDPSSFHDGGIHEQSALERSCPVDSDAEPEQASSMKMRADTITSETPVGPAQTLPTVTPVVAPSHHGTITSAPVASLSTNLAQKAHSQTALHAAGPVTSYTTTTTTATSTTTTTTMLPSASAAATSSTFSMDLLNKDGRIGIYLPDARRARIARFHEKRARRIWRKRIKYDCRKKLADSRPRIKGRFVKRVDKDDE